MLIYLLGVQRLCLINEYKTNLLFVRKNEKNIILV